MAQAGEARQEARHGCETASSHNYKYITHVSLDNEALGRGHGARTRIIP